MGVVARAPGDLGRCYIREAAPEDHRNHGTCVEDENYTLGEGLVGTPRSEGSYLRAHRSSEGRVSKSSSGGTFRHLEYQIF